MTSSGNVRDGGGRWILDAINSWGRIGTRSVSGCGKAKDDTV